ncbi:diguanylate cyclase [Tepidimonas alkaliphilus]|uniref:diguanylate cyclase n=1 Tax=Tepidimonas alkaliphilus TaxID=2588942 RepID=UPI00163DDDD8|nr:diguanylate cyclase [Tepidimonas alkaliphilus]
MALIDANAAARAVVQGLLQAEGADVLALSSGEEALQALAGSWRADVVLVSRHLPDMGALELLRRLRLLPGCAMLPVVLITGDDDEPLRLSALEGGFTEVLVRAAPEQLAPHLRALLRRQADLQRARILLVEDSPAVAAATAEVLAPLGMEVEHALQAHEALERLQHQPYDLLIVDVVLPGALTGLGLLSALRSRRDDLAELPVLAYSSYDERVRRVEMLRRGANDYLTKPIDADELRARVTNLVRYWRLLQQVRRQHAQLAHQAVTDALTGVYNRHLLDEMGPRLVRRAGRGGEPLTVMMLDLDHFKDVNDRHGHERGDQVLQALAQRLRDHVRADDLLVRHGGEEFALLMPRLGADAAWAQAERLRQAVAQQPLAGLALTASLGVCVWQPEAPQPACAAEQAAEGLRHLLRQADQCLYQAKRQGRNRCEMVVVTAWP